MARQQEPEHDLDPLLRQVLRPSSAGLTGTCVNAETLAAWADGTLRRDEVDLVEQHAADCARCRAMLAAFVLSCLVYRELLTRFAETSHSWIGAAAAHAAPNILFTGFAVQGLVFLERPEAWPLFPAPGGLLFPTLVLVAILVVQRHASRLQT
mgnify:CR=1 FL=1